MSTEVCRYCNNERKLLDGSDCLNCNGEIYSFEETDTVLLTVPEQYRQIMFEKRLVNPAMGEYYPIFLDNILKEIQELKLKHKNIFIGSPHQSSKKVLGFAANQILFRKNIPVFPILDILEIKKVMNDMDRGKEPSLLLDFGEVNPSDLYNCPYLFIILPSETTFDVYETAATIKDRRVRRGKVTIFLHSGTWERFIDNDRKGAIKYSAGDGSYGTIDNRTFMMGVSK